MGDKIAINEINFFYGHLFRIELKNERTNKTDMLFVEKEELYKMLENAEKESERTLCQ